MAITLATGTLVAVASTYGTGFTITAISNANPAVATLSASHNVAVGDFIEITSGWDFLTNKVVRVSAVSVNDVTLEGINTTNTTSYPVGSGAGTGREINPSTGWTNIGQIQSISTSGGDQNYTDVTTIADRVQKQMPTTRGAHTIDMTVFDDPTAAYYSVVQTASESSSLVGLRLVFPNGSRLLANGYISMQKTPNVNVNAPLTASINFTSIAEPTRYAS